jgi:3-isopropylmalate/(R)-2-methylmalate dehydratase small subunit
MRLRVRPLSGVISTDDIIAGRYKHMFTDPAELGKHVFESLLPGFAATLRQGDALYSVDTFGVGSSREQAVSALMAAGVVAVIAPRFGRIFFRNAWNLGLFPIEMDGLSLTESQLVDLDVTAGKLIGSFGEVAFTPPPAAMLEMAAAGGLLSLVQQRLQVQGAIFGPSAKSPQPARVGSLTLS